MRFRNEHRGIPQRTGRENPGAVKSSPPVAPSKSYRPSKSIMAQIRRAPPSHK